MTAPIGPTKERQEQLVIELAVCNLERSLLLYGALGFRLERRDRGFAALSFDDRRLFLDEQEDLAPVHGRSRANVRIIVPDVDAVWERVQALALAVEQPLGDRYYGLRDFTIRDLDGHGLRFASPLHTHSDHAASERGVEADGGSKQSG